MGRDGVWVVHGMVVGLAGSGGGELFGWLCRYDDSTE